MSVAHQCDTIGLLWSTSDLVADPPPIPLRRFFAVEQLIFQIHLILKMAPLNSWHLNANPNMVLISPVRAPAVGWEVCDMSPRIAAWRSDFIK